MNQKTKDTKFENLLQMKTKNSLPTKNEIKMVANFIEENWSQFKEMPLEFPSKALQYHLLCDMVGGQKHIRNDKRKVSATTIDIGVRTYLSTGQINSSIANIEE